MHGVCVLCARSPLRKFPPRSPKFLGQAFFLSLTFILVLEWHRSYGSKWHCLVRRRRLRVGRDLAAVAAVEAVEAAGASFTAKPAAAERGDASVEAAVALLLLLGRGSLLLGWVVHLSGGRFISQAFGEVFRCVASLQAGREEGSLGSPDPGEGSGPEGAGSRSKVCHGSHRG